ncbi:methanethiol S-methyltransferase [Maricaulis maris]|uniref:methanethiol S-methyltransferase n=1 Tax=Maricaulis maris TaxID=74318 RepID=UPI003B8CCFBC
MGRAFGFVFGIAVYAFFFAVFLYSIGFVGNLLVPKTIDSGAAGPFAMAAIVNLVLLSVFAVQHSVMARPAFKSAWTRLVPAYLERTIYVLLSSIALALIYAFWQPMPGVIWSVPQGAATYLVQGVFWLGWLIVLISTFLISHFDLFGLSQIYANLRQRPFKGAPFRKHLFYRLVRHPMMTGFMIAFWAAPVMTLGHLLFAIVTTAYMVVAVYRFEEKDLIAEIGDEYLDYRDEAGAFFPKLGRSRPVRGPGE